MRGASIFLGWAAAVAPSVVVAGSVDSCPGYDAGAIVVSRSSLTASLSLAGDACNAYGQDIDHLKLLVEYQTGKWTGT